MTTCSAWDCWLDNKSVYSSWPRARHGTVDWTITQCAPRARAARAIVSLAKRHTDSRPLVTVSTPASSRSANDLLKWHDVVWANYPFYTRETKKNKTKTFLFKYLKKSRQCESETSSRDATRETKMVSEIHRRRDGWRHSKGRYPHPSRVCRTRPGTIRVTCQQGEPECGAALRRGAPATEEAFQSFSNVTPYISWHIQSACRHAQRRTWKVKTRTWHLFFSRTALVRIICHRKQEPRRHFPAYFLSSKNL